MYNAINFFVGLFLGSFFTVAIMCILQINRINEYESQIKSLKQQIEELNNK